MMSSGRIVNIASGLPLFLRRGWRLLLIAVLIVVGLQLLVRIAPAQSTGVTFTVIPGDLIDGTCSPDDLANQGTCTLREAVIVANQTNTAVIVDGVRTAIGRMGGSLAIFRPEELGAFAIKALIEKTKIWVYSFELFHRT